MKKHETKNEEELRMIKTANEKLKYMYLKKGINRDKDTAQEIRYRKYVKDENEIRDILRDTNYIKHKDKVYDAKGNKKEGTHTYPAKSQWKWDREDKEKQGIVKPEIVEVKETTMGIEKEIEIPDKEKPVIIYDGNEIDFFIAKIKPFNKNEFEGKIWKQGKRRKINCILEKWKMEENDEKKIKSSKGEINVKSLIRISLKTGIEIYKIIEIL